MKQNDAVFGAVCDVLGAKGFDQVVELTKDQRDKVVAMVTAGILTGVVDFSTEARAKYNTPAKVKTYVIGMVSNHLRKDKRLNGNTKYEAKNPGSRPKKDPQLEAMKLLQSQYEKGSEAWHEIEAAISDRTIELAASKAKTAEINIEALPENLRYLLRKPEPTTEASEESDEESSEEAI